MHFTWSSLCLCATLSRCIFAAPIDFSVDIADSVLEKRATAGPQIGGANFPDPSIIRVSNVWYSFATRTIGSNIRIQVARSNDFASWSIVNKADGSQHEALPNLPSWVQQSNPNTWAPDVQQLDDGSFILYYSASIASNPKLHCVGAATASSVLGPYKAQSSPLYCPTGQGGAIDAAGLKSDGQRYVVYKVDGNALGNGGPCGNAIAPVKPTPLVLQPVGADGFTPRGGAVSLLDNIGPSEDGVVEAPSLVRSGNTWVLFFSSGCFTSPRYTVNYATSNSVTGPYTRAAQPLFRTGDRGLSAPGGMSVAPDAKHMVFHANQGSGRALYTAEIAISGNKVTA